MKFLAKINRGLILTLIILIVLTTYLVTLSISHAADKSDIKDVCSKYITTAVSYSMIPEKYRAENSEIPKDELNKYIDGMTKDMKAFYTDNEQIYKYVIDENKESLEDQAKGKDIVYSYKKDIADYKKFAFDGKTVTVTILTNSAFDGPSTTQSSSIRESASAQTTDTITLQKVNGKWKVIYAYLAKPINQQSNRGYTYKAN